MVTWQPIETAPKDGTRILVCRDESDTYPVVVEWVNWNNTGGKWWDNQSPAYDLDAFKFWCPLPKPPGG
jgi:hypothetical protein